MGYVIFLLDIRDRWDIEKTYWTHVTNDKKTHPTVGADPRVCPNKRGEDIQDIRNIRDVSHTQP